MATAATDLTPDTDGAPALQAQSTLHGLTRIGPMYLAVPIAAIREVVPHPAALSAIPRTLAEVTGAIDLRGALVPVVDLLHLMHPGVEAASDAIAPAVIMVLRTPHGVIGVGVHQICGVVDLGNDRQTAISLIPGHLTASLGLISAGFVLDGRSGVILDVEALARLPGLIQGADRLVADSVKLAGGTATLTFGVGDHRFGLAADVIEAAVPACAVQPAALSDPLWMASVDYNGRRIPVADTLHLLGLGTCSPARTMATVVVRLNEGGRVALRIDAVQDMIRIRRETWLALDGFAIDEESLIAGVLDGVPPIFMLDGAALAASPVLANLARMEEGSDAELTDRARDDARFGGKRQPFLVFTLGQGQHAVPLEHVAEILPLDRLQSIAFEPGLSRFEGVIPHRGKALPIIDLARLLGVEGAQAPQFILIATDGSRSAGFLLDTLRAVERLVPHEVGNRRDAGGPDNLPGRVIITSEGKTCSVVDLANLIQDRD